MSGSHLFDWRGHISESGNQVAYAVNNKAVDMIASGFMISFVLYFDF